jgi:probable F420-dependent oxidoreductase
VEFGFSVAAINPKGWAEAARLADGLGYESVWLPEHLVLPVMAAGSPYHGSDHPPVPANIPIFDVFAQLGYLAAVTERIKLGTNVYNIGLRHPFVSARGAATVDVLSNGRLAFGIGASWLRAEWDAVGLDFDTRGARVDEAIEVCRRLWTDEVIEHHGRFFDFAPVAFEPKPVQPGGPALHIGGDGPAAIRRAATVGTAWMPMNHTLEDIGPSIDKLHELCERVGRETPVEITMSGRDVAGPDDVARYEAAGVTRLIVQPWTRSREAPEGLTRFAEQVIVPLAH